MDVEALKVFNNLEIQRTLTLKYLSLSSLCAIVLCSRTFHKGGVCV